MAKVKRITSGRTRRVSSELERLYWSLSKDGRKSLCDSAEWRLGVEQRKARQREIDAKGGMRRVSFAVTPEQFVVLERLRGLADADGEWYSPGRAAGEIFEWAFPLLQKLVAEDTSSFPYWRVQMLLFRKVGDVLSFVPGAKRQRLQVVQYRGAAEPDAAVVAAESGGQHD